MSAPSPVQRPAGPTFYLGADFDTDARPLLSALRQHFHFILRYTKNLSSGEITAVKNTGLALGVIFEGGARNSLGGAPAGAADATAFLNRCAVLSLTPAARSAVFITTDTDVSAGQLPACVAYYKSFASAIEPRGWSVGGYACGTLQASLLPAFLDTLYTPWSVGAKGWSGTRTFDLSGHWHLNQGPTLRTGHWPPANTINMLWNGSQLAVPPQSWPDIGIDYDPDIATNLEWAV